MAKVPQPEPPSDPDPNLTLASAGQAVLPDLMDWWEAGATGTFERGGPTDDSGGSSDGDSGGDRPATAPADPPAALDPAGRYAVRDEIGRGGMGAVHAGWDRQLQREIAVKVLLREHVGRPEVVRRFLDEARITSRLSHPGVVAVHELGWSPDGRPYFVMKLVRGQTLAQLLNGRGDAAGDLPQFLAIFLQVCQAVAYAHSQGVIHRDLKPANIMVGAFGAVKVMDWGLAKVLGEGGPDVGGDDPAATPAGVIHPAVTMAGTVFGTPAYLAPEQARGETDRIDRRADVFGLGSILCEILTGQPPYAGADGRETYRRAAAAETAAAVARLDACRAPLDPVVLAKWCLSADPRDRPPDASGVVEVMTAHFQGDRRRAERDLVQFFDLSLDLFCIAGADGYFRRVNGNFQRLLGYTDEEMTSRPFLDFVHPDDRGKTDGQTEQLAVGEPCVQFVNRYRHADGHYLWFEWSAQAVPEERATYAVARDVTDRVTLEEAHRPGERARLHLESAVNSADLAIHSTGLDGTVVSWNPGAEHLYGYRADEVVGQPQPRLYPAGREAEESDALDRLRRGGQVEHFETTRLRRDGTEVPVSLTVSCVRDEAGAVVGTSQVAREIGRRPQSGG